MRCVRGIPLCNALTDHTVGNLCRTSGCGVTHERGSCSHGRHVASPKNHFLIVCVIEGRSHGLSSCVLICGRTCKGLDEIFLGHHLAAVILTGSVQSGETGVLVLER